MSTTKKKDIRVKGKAKGYDIPVLCDLDNYLSGPR